LEGTGRPNLLIHVSVACVSIIVLIFFDSGVAYMAPGLLASNVSHLSQRGKRIFAQELAGLIGRALN